MDEKEKDLKPQELSPEEETQENVNDSEDTVYEENDNWQFDATAPTLENNIELGSDFTIEVNDDVEEIEKPKKKDNKKKTNDKTQVSFSFSKKKIKVAVISALSAVLVAIVIFAGVSIFALPNSKEIMTPGNVALTVGNTKVSVGMYNLYYNLVVSNYESYASYGYFDLDTSLDYSQQTTTDDDGNEITWADVFKRDTLQQLQYVSAYYEPAVEKGITITDEQQETIDYYVETLKSSASEANMSLDNYLSTTYGDYCGLSTIMKFYEQRNICETYYEQLLIELSLSEDELLEYYEANKNNYLNFGYVEMSFDAEETSLSEVEKKVKAYCDEIDSLSTLKKLVPEICEDLIKNAISEGYFTDEETALETLMDSIVVTYSADIIESNFGTEIAQWLQADGDNNTAKYYVNKDDGYACIFFKSSECKPDTTELYSVRHILLSPNGDPSSVEDATEEDWQKAKEKADEVYNLYQNGEKTELAFALLAEEYSDDTNTTSAGYTGSYGGEILETSLGVMVPEFEGWATDKAREYGDVDIVKSDYGYHIMFFIYDGPKYLFDVMNDANTEKQNEYIDSVECKEHRALKNTSAV